ncbi:MAG: hypothetical protein H7Y04_11300 [Verrucomicrobia bacterium]|nr:hypothetical protein [Cytophagales bacterium]
MCRKNTNKGLWFSLLWLWQANLVFAQNVPITPVAAKEMDAFAAHIIANYEGETLRKKGRLITQLTEGALADLPVGIAREYGGTTYVIAIDSAYSDEKNWYLSAYAAIKLPGAATPIAFGARKIVFSRGGLTASNSTKLMLMANQTVAIGETDLFLPGDGSNFIEFDCNGYKSISLKGLFLFKNDVLQPADNSARVGAGFQVRATDLNNMLIDVSISPFKVKGLKDFSFEVRQASVDMSDIANPANMTFPADYQSGFTQNPLLWRGFYLKSVSVKYQLDSTAQEPMIIAAENLIIDDTGVSGLFSVTKLLPIDKGSAGGWAFSIDYLSVGLTQNRLKSGTLVGSLNIPFLGKDTLGYLATMQQTDEDLDYQFLIRTNTLKKYKMPFDGDLTLDKGCMVGIQKVKGKLTASALLNGSMTLNNKLFTAEGIKFERLDLTTDKPYIRGGIFAVGFQARSASFPISIDSLRLAIRQGEIGIGAGVKYNFMNSSDKGFAGSTFIEVMAKVVEVPSQTGENRQEWQFVKVKVGDVSLKAKTTVFTLEGNLQIFEDDPIYGNGFRGSLAFSIDKILDPPVKINAYFGSTAKFRYWHVDVFVPIAVAGKPLYIVPPVLAMNGIMGGMSYHMKRNAPFKPDFAKIGTANASPPANELAFIPDSTTGLAFMAGVALVIGKEEVCNGDVLLEVALRSDGGLKYIRFDGKAFVFAAFDERGRGVEATAPAYGLLSLIYDNENSVFHANIQMYLNVAGGAVRGTGPGNMIGEAVVHVDKKDWYFYVGRPSKMMGIELINFAKANAYFMIGTQIDPLPALPNDVAELAGKLNNAKQRNEVMLRSGGGFALGFHLAIGFDSKDKIKPLYASLMLKAGADVMLKNLGDASCEGRSGTVGANGWYAAGQAYVFVSGKVGIRIRKKNFDILSLGLAAVLEAQLPNPTWLEGTLAGRYSVLGGLVKGSFNTKFSVGEKCNLRTNGSEIDDIEVIADLKPGKDEAEVSVFASPQVSFNVGIGKELKITADGKDYPESYRIMLDEFKAAKNGQTLVAQLVFNDNADVAVLQTTDILPKKSAIKLLVKLHWEKKSATGIWQALKGTNGNTETEERELTFNTGDAPDFIPDNNVLYSYPVKMQYNFYRDEYNKGYVKLEKGQPDVFLSQDDKGMQWQYVARFKPTGSTALEVPISYADNTVSFDMPAALSSGMVYKFTFVRKPLNNQSLDANVKREEKQISTGEVEATVKQNRLEGTLQQAIEKEVYESAFRTSQFATFTAKMSSLTNIQDDLMDIATGYVAVVGFSGNTTETLDKAEIKCIATGNRTSLPLVQAIASSDTRWFRENPQPVLYEKYGEDAAINISWRTPAAQAVAPLREGVSLYNGSRLPDYTLTSDQLQSGSAPAVSGSLMLGYFLSFYSLKDHEDLRNKAANKYLSNTSTTPPESVRRILANNYKDLQRGTYPVEITYVLPGINQVTTRKTINVKY